MPQDIRELWPKVLEELKLRVTPGQFQTWFGTISPGNKRANCVEIKVPNAYYKTWLGRNYKGLLEEVVSVVSQAPATIEFAVESGTAVKPLELDPFLNRKYTFDTFVVGSMNRLAYAAALAVAESPGYTYNPLFLYGCVGLGKTHLLQAICLFLLDKHPSLRVLYRPCEAIVNHFITTVRTKTWESFRKTYRDVDVLVVDDIHSLSSHSPPFREEFFHTFNALYNLQRQIVLSATCPPEEIPSLEARLVSRFKWGLLARIDAPDLETRIALVEKKALLLGLSLSPSVSRFLAETEATNVRELEGTVVRLSRLCSLSNTLPSLDLARRVVGAAPRNEGQSVGIDCILQAVSESFLVPLSVLQSRRRLRSVTVPRQIAMYLARRLTSLSLQEIGGYIGGRDHSTVLYAEGKISALRREDQKINTLVDKIERSLRNPRG